MFRNIYYKIYNDNIFRKSFIDNKEINLIYYHSKIFWNNLKELNNFKDFNLFLKKIIKQNNTYILTTKDKIDYKKAGTHNSLNEFINESTINIIKKLFDEIDSLKDIELLSKFLN